MMVKAAGGRAPTPCGVLQYTRCSGLHDYWLLGSPQVPERVVGTLESRLEAARLNLAAIPRTGRGSMNVLLM